MALVVVSCETSVPATPTASLTPANPIQTGGALRAALLAEISTLDPWSATDADSLLVTRQIYETLVGYDPGGLRIVPRLAESWTVSPDGRIWSFALRKGVKFHDGTDLVAAAVALNFERARLRAHPQRGKGAFAPFAAAFGGFDDASVLTKIEARDAATVVFTTRTPFGPFLASLAMPSFAVVSPRSFADDPARWATSDSRGAAGTGPFTIAPGAWQRDGQITLERNASYWGQDPGGRALPYLDRVVFRPIRDEAARMTELRAGGLDLIREASAVALPQAKADPNLAVVARPALSVAYLGVSLAIKPFDKVDVRRSVAMVIDEQRRASAIFAPDVRPASQLLVPGLLGYDDSVVEFTRYDTSAAKRLLADAGFPNGFATEVWYPQSWREPVDPKRIAEAVAADLAKIGIAAAVRTGDAAQYRADARAGRLPLWLDDVGGDSADPDAFLGGVAESGAWANPVAQSLLRRAREEIDPSKRSELYKQVSKMVQQEVPKIPLFTADPHLVMSRKVRGLTPHPSGGEPFALVWLGR